MRKLLLRNKLVGLTCAALLLGPAAIALAAVEITYKDSFVSNNSRCTGSQTGTAYRNYNWVYAVTGYQREVGYVTAPIGGGCGSGGAGTETGPATRTHIGSPVTVAAWTGTAYCENFYTNGTSLYFTCVTTQP